MDSRTLPAAAPGVPRQSAETANAVPLRPPAFLSPSLGSTNTHSILAPLPGVTPRATHLKEGVRVHLIAGCVHDAGRQPHAVRGVCQALGEKDRLSRGPGMGWKGLSPHPSPRGPTGIRGAGHLGEVSRLLTRQRPGEGKHESRGLFSLRVPDPHPAMCSVDASSRTTKTLRPGSPAWHTGATFLSEPPLLLLPLPWWQATCAWPRTCPPVASAHPHTSGGGAALHYRHVSAPRPIC